MLTPDRRGWDRSLAALIHETARFVRHTALPWLSPRYACPVCGRPVPHFLPIPQVNLQPLDDHQCIHALTAVETQNWLAYTCPICGATDRDRLYFLYLQKRLGELDRSRRYRFIDFAPSALLTPPLRALPYLEYRTADLLRQDVDDPGVDLCHMPIYADGSVDIFLCSHMLEHVPDDRQALRELYRILKPGGWGILMAPIMLTLSEVYENPAYTSEADRIRHYGQADHVRMYSHDGFIARLKEAGFTVRALDQRDFGAAVFARHGISPRSVLYVVEK